MWMPALTRRRTYRFQCRTVKRTARASCERANLRRARPDDAVLSPPFFHAVRGHQKGPEFGTVLDNLPAIPSGHEHVQDAPSNRDPRSTATPTEPAPGCDHSCPMGHARDLACAVSPPRNSRNSHVRIARVDRPAHLWRQRPGATGELLECAVASVTCKRSPVGGSSPIA